MRSHFKRSLGATLLAGVLLLSACSSDTAAFELTSAVDSQELLAEPPAGLTVLDIRTPEEFASGYIAGATNLDFYEAQFSNWLDELQGRALLRLLPVGEPIGQCHRGHEGSRLHRGIRARRRHRQLGQCGPAAGAIDDKLVTAALPIATAYKEIGSDD